MFQTGEDLIIFIGWVFHNVSLILQEIFLPLRYIFAFLHSAVQAAFGPAVSPEGLSYTFPSAVMNMFHNMPFFDEFISGTLILLGFVCLVSAFKLFQKV
jgi:hypothetical protein